MTSSGHVKKQPTIQRALRQLKATPSVALGQAGSASPHGSNGSISITIVVMSIEQGSIVTSPIEKSAD
jgi:hypothetical protein